MPYAPYEHRVPDTQYRDLVARILDQGEKVPTRQGPYALTLLQQSMRFDLANGFPMITERSLQSFWRKPIGELCAFINGATTLDELVEFGCDWWDDWATEEKTAKRDLPLRAACSCSSCNSQRTTYRPLFASVKELPRQP